MVLKPLPLHKNLNKRPLSERLQETNFRLKPKLRNKFAFQRVAEIKQMQLTALNKRYNFLQQAILHGQIPEFKLQQARQMLKETYARRQALIAEIYGKERFNIEMSSDVLENIKLQRLTAQQLELEQQAARKLQEQLQQDVKKMMIEIDAVSFYEHIKEGATLQEVEKAIQDYGLTSYFGPDNALFKQATILINDLLIQLHNRLSFRNRAIASKAILYFLRENEHRDSENVLQLLSDLKKIHPKVEPMSDDELLNIFLRNWMNIWKNHNKEYISDLSDLSKYYDFVNDPIYLENRPKYHEDLKSNIGDLLNKILGPHSSRFIFREFKEQIMLLDLYGVGERIAFMKALERELAIIVKFKKNPQTINFTTLVREIKDQVHEKHKQMLNSQMKRINEIVENDPELLELYTRTGSTYKLDFMRRVYYKLNLDIAPNSEVIKESLEQLMTLLENYLHSNFHLGHFKLLDVLLRSVKLDVHNQADVNKYLELISKLRSTSNFDTGIEDMAARQDRLSKLVITYWQESGIADFSIFAKKSEQKESTTSLTEDDQRINGLARRNESESKETDKDTLESIIDNIKLDTKYERYNQNEALFNMSNYLVHELVDKFRFSKAYENSIRVKVREIFSRIASRSPTNYYDLIKLVDFILNNVKLNKDLKLDEPKYLNLLESIYAELNIIAPMVDEKKRDLISARNISNIWLESGLADLSRINSSQEPELTEAEKKAVLNMPFFNSPGNGRPTIALQFFDAVKSLKVNSGISDKIEKFGNQILKTIELMKYSDIKWGDPKDSLGSIFIGLFYEISKTKDPEKIIKFLQNFNTKIIIMAMQGKLLKAIVDEQGQIKEIVFDKNDFQELVFSFAKELKKVKLERTEIEEEFDVWEEIKKTEYEETYLNNVAHHLFRTDFLIPRLDQEFSMTPDDYEDIRRDVDNIGLFLKNKIDPLELDNKPANEQLARVLKVYIDSFRNSQNYDKNKLADFISIVKRILLDRKHIVGQGQLDGVLYGWENAYKSLNVIRKDTLRKQNKSLKNTSKQFALHSAVEIYQKQLINLARGIQDPKIQDAVNEIKSLTQTSFAVLKSQELFSHFIDLTKDLPELLRETVRALIFSSMGEGTLKRLTDKGKLLMNYFNILEEASKNKDYGFFFRSSIQIMKNIYQVSEEDRSAIQDMFRNLIKKNPELVSKSYTIIDIATENLEPKNPFVLDLLFAKMPNNFKLRLYQKALLRLDFRIKLNILQNREDRDFFITTLKDFFNLFGNTINTLKKLYNYLDKLSTESKLTVQSTIVFLESLNKYFILKELTDMQIDELFNLANRIKAENTIMNTREVLKQLDNLFAHNESLKRLSNNLKYDIFTLILDLTIKYPNHKDKIVHFLEPSLNETLALFRFDTYNSLLLEKQNENLSVEDKQKIIDKIKQQEAILLKRLESSLSNKVRFDIDKVIEMDNDKPVVVPESDNVEPDKPADLEKDEKIRKIELTDADIPTPKTPFSDATVTDSYKRIERIEIDDEPIDDLKSRTNEKTKIIFNKELSDEELDYLLKMTNATEKDSSDLDYFFRFISDLPQDKRDEAFKLLLNISKSKGINIKSIISLYDEINKGLKGSIEIDTNKYNIFELLLDVINKFSNFSESLSGLNKLINYVMSRSVLRSTSARDITKYNSFIKIVNILKEYSENDLAKILKHVDLILSVIGQGANGESMYAEIKTEFDMLLKDQQQYIKSRKIEMD